MWLHNIRLWLEQVFVPHTVGHKVGQRSQCTSHMQAHLELVPCSCVWHWHMRKNHQTSKKFGLEKNLCWMAGHINGWVKSQTTSLNDETGNQEHVLNVCKTAGFSISSSHALLYVWSQMYWKKRYIWSELLICWPTDLPTYTTWWPTDLLPTYTTWFQL